ncbi:hypothetical protein SARAHDANIELLE_89 [Hafnia phage vB_HpaM_SarahDanielle]|uniref:Uncharacterized protein n=1 Tax=Hafnia phage vB_HpaM_SarahDanielle TaxID=2836113 RepID=A0AAE7WA85_9CAUD|nr:hypothetical protein SARAHDANIELLE_89 [Hafnia phage vB_HpaM_SarahDanielle]
MFVYLVWALKTLLKRSKNDSEKISMQRHMIAQIVYKNRLRRL